MKSNNRTGTNKRIDWNFIKEKISVQALITVQALIWPNIAMTKSRSKSIHNEKDTVLFC